MSKVMSQDQWESLYDDPDVQEILEYAEWLREYRGGYTSTTSLIEVLRAGKSRVEQLRKYQEKRRDPESKFRPYAPLKLSETERGNAKRAAIAEGVATVRDSRPGQCPARNERGRRCLLPVGHELDAFSATGGHEF